MMLNSTGNNQRQKTNFDSRHRARQLCPLPVNSKVFIPGCQKTGQVISQPIHRSYAVSTPTGTSDEIGVILTLYQVLNQFLHENIQNMSPPTRILYNPMQMYNNKYLNLQTSLNNQILLTHQTKSSPAVDKSVGYPKDSTMGRNNSEQLTINRTVLLLYLHVKESCVMCFIVVVLLFLSVIALRYSPKEYVLLIMVLFYSCYQSF